MCSQTLLNQTTTHTMKITNFLATLSLLCTIAFNATATAPSAPTNLRCFDKSSPIGCGYKPYFGWYVNDIDQNEVQKAYQILVSSSPEKLKQEIGDVWNSGKVVSDKQNYIYSTGKPLSSATTYYWKVRTWDKDNNISPYSKGNTFVTGLFTNNDWNGAKWIKRDSKDNDDYTYFRKSISLTSKKIKKAIAYIAACQSYELYVNGKFVCKGFDNHYPQYSYYNGWDITSILTPNASNTFACLTHWYGGGQGRATGARGLLVKTIIEYTDGSILVVGTDNTWKQVAAEQWIQGQPQRNGEGIGRVELFDSRKEINQWQNTQFDDSAWQNATEIGTQPVAPWSGTLRPDLTRVIEQEIKPQSVKALGNGKYVIDLGKVYSGSFKIGFEGGNSGDTIRMVGGFVLNGDGSVSRKMNQDTRMDFYFIHNGKKATSQPYVYLGMRYLEVENSPNALTNENVSFMFRHFELNPSQSSFSSSNPMLNNVWQIMIQSLLVGAQESFVDTPTREKGGFLVDGWAQAVPSMTTMNDRVMNLRTLSEFLDSQDHYWPDGRINAVYPNVDGGRDIPDFTLAFLVWVWDYYQQTGNIDFLNTHYARLKKVADYVAAYRNDTTGLIHNLKGGKGPYEFGIIDWPATMRYGYDMKTASRTVVDAYAFLDFDILGKIAILTGHTADGEIYRTKANQLKQAINTRLINSQGLYIDGLYADGTASEHVSQHANSMPLALNIVSLQNRKLVATEVVKQKMSMGMVALRWLPEALGQANEGDALIDLYTNTLHDGWAKSVSLGATTTWESWGANENNDSMSHPWGAVGLLGIQNYILGITTLSPQNAQVQIKPLWFGDKLTSAKGSYATDKGNILVDWHYEKNCYTMKLYLPVNVTAHVYIPTGNKASNTVLVDGKATNATSKGDYLYIGKIGSGAHTFSR